MAWVLHLLLSSVSWWLRWVNVGWRNYVYIVNWLISTLFLLFRIFYDCAPLKQCYVNKYIDRANNQKWSRTAFEYIPHAWCGNSCVHVYIEISMLFMSLFQLVLNVTLRCSHICVVESNMFIKNWLLTYYGQY